MLRLFVPVVIAILVPPVATLALGSILAIGETDTPIASDPTSFGPGGSGQDAIRNRLATTIAFRAGLIRIASAEEADILRKAHPMAYGRGALWLPVINDLGFCAPSPSSAAILATESYLRPTFIRKIEQIAAEIVVGLTGGLPDWSYGPAQVRPSTADRILGLTEDRLHAAGPQAGIVRKNDRMLEALLEPCDAIALVDLSLVVAPAAGDGPKEHALRHLGGKPIPTLPGVIEYTDMVDMVVNVLLAASDTARDLNEARFPDETDPEPGPTDEPSVIVWPASGWSEPHPRYCLENADGTYRFNRSFAVWPEGAEAAPLRTAILVETYASQDLWDARQTVDWSTAAQFFHGRATAAEIVGLPVEALRVAAPGVYPMAEELAQDAGCSAILLQGPP